MTLLQFRVRVSKRDAIVIPKKLGELEVVESMALELSSENNRIVLEIRDLWSGLRE